MLSPSLSDRSCKPPRLLPVTRRLLGALVLLHFALGGLFGLSVDEAHYALYARHLALSYFDHPPLVGWIQWPLVALDAPVALLRTVAEMLWLGTALLVHAVAVRLQGTEADAGRAGFFAVLTFALAPLLHVLGIGLLPDTLLMFFSIALMWQTLNLMAASNLQRTRPWLVLGVLLGLAGLSKYTAILVALAVAVCLLHAHGAKLLRNPRLWLAAALALLLVLPVALWNYRNDWISFRYQAAHGAGSAWLWANWLRFMGLQLLAYGPLLLGGLFVLRLTPKVPPWVLQTFFVLPFLVLSAMAGGGSSLPHWSAPAWVTIAPLAGLAWQRVRSGVWRKVLVALAFAQAALCAGLFVLMLAAGQPLLGADDPASPNPFADLHGWDEAGRTAGVLARQQQLSSVAVQNWTLASRLGWYARPLPVHVLEDRFDQFDLWAGDLPIGADTLLVDWSAMSYEVPVGAGAFANCRLLQTQEVLRFGRRVSSFRFYACHAWGGRPAPHLQEHP
jgi:4-amino-4-deoxy-L-arabinose transferase-like glycosyltransferase